MANLSVLLDVLALECPAEAAAIRRAITQVGGRERPAKIYLAVSENIIGQDLAVDNSLTSASFGAIVFRRPQTAANVSRGRLRYRNFSASSENRHPSAQTSSLQRRSRRRHQTFVSKYDTGSGWMPQTREEAISSLFVMSLRLNLLVSRQSLPEDVIED